MEGGTQVSSGDKACCLLFAIMVGGCSTCTVSDNLREIEIEKINSAERMQINERDSRWKEARK
jgi:hypothetical protein